MGFQHLHSEVRDGVLILRMDDPGTRNALGPDLTREMQGEIDRFAKDSELRALVLTGTDPAFSSGANVRGFQRQIDRPKEEQEAPAETTPWEELDPSRYLHTVTPSAGPPLIAQLHHLQKPSIAAVNGAAYGQGCGLALSCDIRIASEQARFSEAFVRNGLVSADGSCWQLPRLIGMSNTLLMQYTGDPVDGNEAYRLGLCSRVVPHKQLMDAALELATRLAHGPTYAYALTKMLVHKALNQTLEEALIDGGHAQALARKTEDHREGVRAFLEKRQPQFKGR